MTNAITILALWDDEAHVWSLASPEVPGLHIEADRYEAIEWKALMAIEDLAEFEPEVAALIGRPIVIQTDWPHADRP